MAGTGDSLSREGKRRRPVGTFSARSAYMVGHRTRRHELAQVARSVSSFSPTELPSMSLKAEVAAASPISAVEFVELVEVVEQSFQRKWPSLDVDVQAHPRKASLRFSIESTHHESGPTDQRGKSHASLQAEVNAGVDRIEALRQAATCSTVNPRYGTNCCRWGVNRPGVGYLATNKKTPAREQEPDQVTVVANQCRVVISRD